MSELAGCVSALTCRNSTPGLALARRGHEARKAPDGHVPGNSECPRVLSCKIRSRPRWRSSTISSGFITGSACIRLWAIAVRRSSSGKRVVLNSHVCYFGATSWSHGRAWGNGTGHSSAVGKESGGHCLHDTHS